MLARRVSLALGITVMTVMAGGCAGESTDPRSTGSPLAPLTVPPSTTVSDPGASSTTTTVIPSVPKQLTPTAVLGTLTVEQQGPCSQGRGSIRVTHDPGASSILRQISAIVDGTQASTGFSDGSDRFEIPGVICDGTIRTVLVVAVDIGGDTQSRAFAVRMTA
jgi:hypothetical protein